mmetsp:Transcript_494/g.1619  ORF Transcript_494/g.1619 Transcript_494/m.1619 type:complete len:229 (+) Transcript_494:1485-2171(+)
MGQRAGEAGVLEVQLGELRGAGYGVGDGATEIDIVKVENAQPRRCRENAVGQPAGEVVLRGRDPLQCRLRMGGARQWAFEEVVRDLYGAQGLRAEEGCGQLARQLVVVQIEALEVREDAEGGRERAREGERAQVKLNHVADLVAGHIVDLFAITRASQARRRVAQRGAGALNTRGKKPVAEGNSVHISLVAARVEDAQVRVVWVGRAHSIGAAHVVATRPVAIDVAAR